MIQINETVANCTKVSLHRKPNSSVSDPLPTENPN
ncbi:hypothetical protein SLEP1_g28414 [Rubroshorea leprosula]|uniref:Uncharacterized protein n=1 Tax=Rubroshorea leprosula TaxID=152421 RepID=A0AAV5K298_9ROSI|nr:hypothetical protein SLEP1_g28414 [Rubroshorea leprosula]